MRHFLADDDLSPDEQAQVLRLAATLVLLALAVTAALTVWLPRFSTHGHRPKVFPGH